MRRARSFTCGLALLAMFPAAARAWDRGQVHTFAALPVGASGPEGLEVDASGNVYVATFGFTANGTVTGEGQLFVFDKHGHLLRRVSITGSSPNLLGLHLRASTGKLLVADFGHAQVLEVDPVNGSATVFMTLPPLPHPGGSSLNDITEDHAGNIYVSDSFQGIVWTTGPQGGVATAFVDDPLLRTAGVPPFGANGLRFNGAQTALFVANTGNDTVVKVPVSAGVAGTPAVFTNSINGADGIEIDADGNLWVVANQADEIVVIDPTGKAIAKLGDFGGAIEDGSPVQLLFPASLRFSGSSLLVTNLALDLRLVNPAFVSVDSAWCAQVTRYTVSKLPARIPGLNRGEKDDRD